ncbi:hypothetical protein D3C76_1539910 [compost metagenome]
MALFMPETTLFQISVTFIIPMRQVFLLDVSPSLLTFGRGCFRVAINKMLEFIDRYPVRNKLKAVR